MYVTLEDLKKRYRDRGLHSYLQTTYKVFTVLVEQ